MKRLLFFLAAAAIPLAAQTPGCVSIVDTVYAVGTPGPAKMNGTIDLQLGYTSTDGGFTIVESAGRQTVAAGALSACPVPGFYTASYTVRLQAPMTGTSTFDRYWVIPTGVPGPYALSDIPTATVNVSGAAVTWVNGMTFGSIAPGDTVTIAGNPFTVATVNSLQSLTLTTPAGALPNVSISDGPIERQTFSTPFPATIAGPQGPSGVAPNGTTTAPAWLNVGGETPGSWMYTSGVLGEHAIINNGKIYAPVSAWQTIAGDNTTSGIAVLDPATGAQLANYTNKTSMLSPCIEAAPAIDIRGHIHAWGCTETSGLTQIDPTTGSVTASLHVPNAVDWEAVPYDPVNDLILYSSGNASFNGLRAVHAADYTTAWTNTDMALGSGGSYTDAPALIVGGYVYFKDIGGSVYKINLATGVTAAFEHATAVVDGAQTYAQMIYDSVHSLLLVTNNDHTAYALNVSDLSVAWSKDIPDTTFSFKRGGAYNPTTGIWYVTARDVPPALGSKVYALDVANAGNIVWTNTTAYDNAAQISSLLADDSYVYCGTFDYAANTYNRYLVINASTGALVETFRLVNGVSSSSPVVWGGKFVMGIWTTFGYEALQVRAGGGTGDFPYKADAYMTGYVQPFTSGALLAQPNPGMFSSGDALRISSATNLPGGLFVGTCGGKSPGLSPCKIQPSDLGSSPSSSLFLRGDGTWAAPTATAAPGGSNGQIQYNNSGVLSGFTPKVNSVNVTTPSGMNFTDSAATNGLTWHFTNPNLGVIQLSVTGTLDNSGLTSSSFTTSVPSWLSVVSPVSLGGGLSITAASGQAPHRVIGTCGTATSFSPCSLGFGDMASGTVDGGVTLDVGTSGNINANNTYVYVANSGTGTQANRLARLQGGLASVTSTGSGLQSILGVCVSGCGTSGTAKIQTSGLTNLIFDSGTTANMGVVSSTTVAGDGTVTTNNLSGLVAGQSFVGYVLTTNASPGTYQILLQVQANTHPFRPPATVASLPTICTISQVVFVTDAQAGSNMYYCTAANTWTQMSHVAATTSMLKGDGLGNAGPATAGADYQAPLGFTPENVANKNANNGYAGLSGGGVLPRSIGGLNSATPGTGFLRDGATPTAGELSGDCTTSGSFSINCTKTGGVSFAPSATTDTTNAGNLGSGTLPDARLSANVKRRAIGYTFDGNGSALSSGVTKYLTVPFACTISAWNFAIDTGTATVKLWKIATGTAIPTVANSISTSGVSISSGTAIHSTTLTDFTTTAVSANDIVGFNLFAVSSATFVNFILECDQ